MSGEAPLRPALPVLEGDTAERLAEEMSIIAEIGRIVSSTLKIEEVYERFAEQARKLIPFDWITVNIHNPADDTYTIAYLAGTEIPGRRVGDVLPLKGSLSGWVTETRRGLLLLPADEAEITARFPDPAATYTFRAGMRSLIVVPLIFQDAVIGTLNLRSKEPNAYRERHLRLAERIGMQIAGAMAVAQLYAELKEKENSLRESKERCARLIAAVPDAVLELDAEGRICLANEGAVRLSGSAGEAELLGRNILEFVAPGDLDRARENLRRTGIKRIPPQEYQAIVAGGRRVVVELHGDVLRRGDNGAGFRSVQVCRDITERKRAETELRRTLDELESRVRRRTAELAEINVALRVLLEKRDEDQRRFGEGLQASIEQLVRPFLQKLRSILTDEQGVSYLNIAEANLENLFSPFLNHLTAAFRNLTAKEIQIAEMIRQGMESKEIAALLSLSVATVHTHRNNIRKKLSLRKGRANLRSHLLSLAGGGGPLLQNDLVFSKKRKY
jgi:PAS domain S-box-containing protein